MKFKPGDKVSFEFVEPLPHEYKAEYMDGVCLGATGSFLRYTAGGMAVVDFMDSNTECITLPATLRRLRSKRKK